MSIDRALRGQSLSGAKGVSRKTLYSGAGFPCVETNDSQGNPKNCPNFSNRYVKTLRRKYAFN